MPAVGPASRSQPLKRKRNTKKESSISVPTDIPLAQLELNDSGGAPSHSGRAFDDDSNDEELFPEIDDTPGHLNEDDSASGSEEEMEGSSDESYLIEDSDFVDEVDSNDNGVGGDDLKEMKTSFRGETVLSKITGRPKRVYPTIEPDYDSDSSTEDDPNRIGNVPLHWYDDLPHIGYNVDGKRVLRPAKGDELDKFLSTVDDPSGWTAGFDKLMQSEQQLSAEELDIIRRLQAAENPDASYNPYEPTVEWFTGKGKEEVMPISGRPEPKRRWQPSKWEKQKVMKIVRAIRQGRILPHKPTTTKPQHYDLWGTPASDHPPPLPAPKVSLPGHAESYNPPEEYLPTPDEATTWQNTEKEDRDQNFLPQKYSSLRLVPGYEEFIHERFSRLLDLYLAPRVQRKKLNIDPESLLPSLPAPETLKPFPIFEFLRLSSVPGKSGRNRIRAVSTSPDGVWIVSGDEGGYVRIWETTVGREAAMYKFTGRIGSIAWCPSEDVSFFVVGVEEAIHVLIPPYLPPDRLSATSAVLKPLKSPHLATESAATLQWIAPATPPKHLAPVLTIQQSQRSGLVKQLTFHRRGDYFTSISDSGNVWIHQVSKQHSQSPFKKIKGSIQRVQFHPTKPHFFVATQRYIRLYDLLGQKLLKTLKPGIRWISTLDIHPSGDHLIVGGYDRKLTWFDLDLSEKPYKVLKYHTRAIRSVHFHPKYPLFATSSDDGTIQIFHARVFSDYTTDPLIVPLKVLRGHTVVEGLGVLDVRWCQNTPWLVSAGADGDVVLWCN